MQHQYMFRLSMTLAAVGLACGLHTAQATTETSETTEAEQKVELNVPCPPFWTVQPNPSMDNSLAYLHDSGKIAVTVSYIADKSGSKVSAETFARVAAEQMECSLPVKSNMLESAWAFTCANDIEALVYGNVGDLVLLSISGRNADTENYLDGFLRFLSFQASRR